MTSVALAGIVLFGLFFLLIFFGVPIAVSIGLSTLVAGLTLLPFDEVLIVVAQQFVTGIDSFVLLSLIFFTLAGSIMNTGGIAQRLINFAKLLAGRMPGSLAHTNVIGNTLFGALSGSAIASAATMGKIMSPLQKKEGYDPTYSAAVNIASAPAGLIIPPSGTPIIYSVLSGGTSIGALFIAGYLPGILMAVLIMIMAFIVAKRRGYAVSDPIRFSQAMRVTLQAIPSLLLIVVVIGGISLGVFTATEGAAVAILYAVILCLIYRSLTWKDIPVILRDTVIFSGVILLLIGASSAMSWILSYSKLPQFVSEGILQLSDNKMILILIMVLLLLLVGTFMDIAPALLIFTPILLPIALELGVHPVHFGMIMSMGLAIGTITPPVGTVLFIGSKVGDVSIEQVTKPLLLFYIPVIIAFLAVAYIPAISLWLPELMGVLE
ncbi:TRAP transporter large permease [Terribacillus sp. DMT04]|uniref:TRAP transporter large permease n=1 Tax=Terribacillus sp. DMT04 TaxID=2850441 RepID=UPI001C2C4CBC|nr:TRAP transporter large permease [Terribacillus sp. DMT04]QXE02017.1 TRAP transporter large permease [Terribacillus sp. DMT04]